MILLILRIKPWHTRTQMLVSQVLFVTRQIYLNSPRNGYLDEDIEDELSISERTVKEIQVHLTKKWNIQSISSAIDYL